MLTLLKCLVSFLVVAFGQPSWYPILGLVAAVGGYALFWHAIIDHKRKFWLGTAWYMGVLLIQLSWFISHPYLYIYILWVTLSFLFALPFGVITLLTTRRGALFVVPALWTLFEWSKLFILSGYTWNPVGLGFGGSLYTLQLASIAGVFGLSFLVMFTNMLVLQDKKIAWITAAIAPYIIGGAIFHYHEGKMEEHPNENLRVVLVQTAFPIEEAMHFKSQEHLVSFVMDEWRQILKITAKHHGKKIDLMALPEFVVPFGTYTYVFDYDAVKESIRSIYGEEALPPKDYPFAMFREGKWMVNNAFWMQAISNYFNSPVVAGLEDVDELPSGERKYFSAAIYFEPNQMPFEPRRYSKRVLVPMGEYIPFSFVRDLASSYGICGSFTCGEEAVAWPCAASKFGVSICYEETFGHLMRENRTKGAEFLINLTNDAWYPHSRLPSQHLEHARMRTVENGFPLLRACNTGITVAIDSLGRNVAILGADSPDPESLSDSLYAEVPSYHYLTLYSLFGDFLIIGFSLLALVFYRFFC